MPETSKAIICVNTTVVWVGSLHVIHHPEFQKIYERLDITVEERGESFYQEMMPDMVKDLEAKGNDWI